MRSIKRPRTDISRPASQLIGQKPNPWFNVLAAVVVVTGIIYTGIHLADDLSVVRDTRVYPYILLGIALVIALGFEFVNGFHDTANAVATVIYTNSMSPNLAVVWSGFFNFSGRAGLDRRRRFRHRVAAAGRVDPAGGQRRRLRHGVRAVDRRHPVEFRHVVFRSALIEFAYSDRLHHRRRTHEPADGREPLRHQRRRLEPGHQDRRDPAHFAADRLQRGVPAADASSRRRSEIPALYKEPEGNKPPPLWIRGLLILTCTGVSFFHGGNDGQKGMGLIMLILIGTVPTAYALNRTMHEQDVSKFVAVSAQAQTALSRYGAGAAPADPHAAAMDMVRARAVTPQGVPALAALAESISTQVERLPFDGQGSARLHGQHPQ